jgi:acetyltransferase-like isoleucine patch superfamily enzyme
MVLINYILNRIIGVQRRYKHVLRTDFTTRFLPNFSIVKNRLTGSQNYKAEIGKECLLGVKIILETPDAKVSIGDRVYMGNSTIIAKTSVSLGNDILVAWGVTFYDHDSHSLDFSERDKDIKQTYKDFINEKGNYLRNKNWDVVNSRPIIISDHAWIGAESMILKGVTIGEGAIVGARSVVTKDVPPFTVVAGNPARIVKNLKPE